jgi:hypothetical protein
MMTQDEFYYLYINTNSILDLGMKEAARGLEDLFASGEIEELARLTDQEVMSDEQLAKHFENMDQSAMDGINMDFFSQQDDESMNNDSKQESLSPEEERLNKALDIELSKMTAELEETETSEQHDEQEEFNIDTYISNIYSEQEELARKTSNVFGKADIKQLSIELNKLPSNLASLCCKLSGEQLMQWVEIQNTDNDALDNLIVSIRQLDF